MSKVLVEVLRFSFGDEDYIVKNNEQGWRSYYDAFGIGHESSTRKVVVTVEQWDEKKLANLREWGN